MRMVLKTCFVDCKYVLSYVYVYISFHNYERCATFAFGPAWNSFLHFTTSWLFNSAITRKRATFCIMTQVIVCIKFTPITLPLSLSKNCSVWGSVEDHRINMLPPKTIGLMQFLKSILEEKRQSTRFNIY